MAYAHVVIHGFANGRSRLPTANHLIAVCYLY